MATNSENTPARRLDDLHPDAAIDWSKPGAPAVPQSSTAGAARQGGNTSDDQAEMDTHLADGAGQSVGGYGNWHEAGERGFESSQPSIPPLTAPAPLTDAIAAVKLLRDAISKQLDPSWECNSDHPALEVAMEQTAHFEKAAPAPQQSEQHLPGWERGIATVTLSGHQLREALDFLNPDGDDDPEQRDNDLTFGIVQHKDDDGKASTGMCCWNDDTDGVLPLDGEYEVRAKAAPAAPVQAEQAQAEVDIDTPEFIDLLSKFAHEASCEEFDEAEYNAAGRALIDHIKAAKVALPAQAEQVAAVRAAEWISVEDRLPEAENEDTGRDVMVSDSLFIRGIAIDGGEAIGLGDYSPDAHVPEAGWRCYGGDYDFMHFAKVTHWMKPKRPAAPSTATSNDTGALGDTGGAK